DAGIEQGRLVFGPRRFEMKIEPPGLARFVTGGRLIPSRQMITLHGAAGIEAPCPAIQPKNAVLSKVTARSTRREDRQRLAPRAIWP
ncbi:hypothetical protein, partial [Mesorhizobium sp. M8A.F.Ca.ET.021.01.1.1]|uniref:hypothetical protein n=1 Tax=Mesorhizobium sp. M8A.F.Ca.ET.021.01.1.1 TaxID=2496757 RepID=UPI001AECCB74